MPEAGFNGVKRKLLKWYNLNKRTLPWRETSNPYYIWLSEVILQQTRVEQGMPYYLAFVNKYPNVKKLAQAPIDDILKLWQGLGYYSRAINLHTTAKIILNNYNGAFPNKFEDILKLKGVGKYTASAIASIAYNQPYAVVDGNVIRFVARFMGIVDDVNNPKVKKQIETYAHKMLDNKNPGEFNQAIMEFGATRCKPRQPECGDCMFKKECVAYAKEMINVIPLKVKRLNKKNRYFNYFILAHKNEILLNKREKSDIWKGLYDFLLYESNRKLSPELLMRDSFFTELKKDNKFTHISFSKEYKHILTHQTIYCRFYLLRAVNRVNFSDKNLIWASVSDIEGYAMPALLDKFMQGSVEWKQFLESSQN